MRILLILSICFSFSVVEAQNYPYLASAKNNGLGSVQVSLHDINGMMANPASSSGVKKFGALVSVQDRFVIQDIRSAHALAAYTFDGGSVGIGLSYQGFEYFKDQGVFLNYSRRILENLYVGTNLHFREIQISEHGSTNWFTFQLGIYVPLSDDWNISASIYNPLSVKINEVDTDVTMISVGLQFSPSEKTNLFIEVDKDVDFSPNLKIGAEYFPLDQLCFRVGYSSQPSSVYLGFGYFLANRISIDIASSYHNHLGYSPTASLSIDL